MILSKVSIRFPHGVIVVNEGAGDWIVNRRQSPGREQVGDGNQPAGTRSAATDGQASRPLRKFSV